MTHPLLLHGGFWQLAELGLAQALAFIGAIRFHRHGPRPNSISESQNGLTWTLTSTRTDGSTYGTCASRRSSMPPSRLLAESLQRLEKESQSSQSRVGKCPRKRAIFVYTQHRTGKQKIEQWWTWGWSVWTSAGIGWEKRGASTFTKGVSSQPLRDAEAVGLCFEEQQK